MKDKTLILIFSFLIVISLGVIFLVPKGGANVAKIYVDGKIYKEVFLSETQNPYTMDLGTGNVLFVEKDGVSMVYADCPDKLCIKRGKITDGAYPIICLPHKVTVTLDGGEVDGVSE